MGSRQSSSVYGPCRGRGPSWETLRELIYVKFPRSFSKFCYSFIQRKTNVGVSGRESQKETRQLLTGRRGGIRLHRLVSPPSENTLPFGG